MTRSRRTVSRDQERRVGKEIGGRAVPGSGSIAALPGDAENKIFLGELKFTRGSSISIKMADLKKIERLAVNRNRRPFFLFEFKGDDFRKGYAWIAFPDWVAQEIMEKLGP